MKKFLQKKDKRAFTLAEVLITLGIIGIVAEITIPTLMHDINDQAFKVSYKKAYSDISIAFMQAIQQNDLTQRSTTFDAAATASEWTVMKSAFKVAKECGVGQLNECWKDADKICTGACIANAPNASSSSFVDAAGRSWAQYSADENIYVVDTNGFKSPNKFGKDRWIFTLNNADNTRTSSGLPAKVGILLGDQPAKTDWCNYPPCNYYSWLYN